MAPSAPFAPLTSPGPPEIPPDSCPSGLVVHAYSMPDKRLLLTQYLEPGSNVTLAATIAAAQATTALVCLVAYCGSTGRRFAAADWR